MSNLDKIKEWVKARNLQTGDPRQQMCKTVEELGELANAINKNKINEAKDGLGDVIVTLVCIAEQLQVDINECIDIAYNEIKDRKGRLINGLFVKESDLPDNG